VLTDGNINEVGVVVEFGPGFTSGFDGSPFIYESCDMSPVMTLNSPQQ
jgi:hypothetical protein